MDKHSPDPAQPRAPQLRPDGDVVLADDAYAHFTVPTCVACSGVLKPGVVFFGDNVPVSVKAQADSFVRESDTILCVGTSLAVWSSFRLISDAHKLGKTLICVNDGTVRGHELFHLVVHGRLGDVLPAALRRMN